MSDTNYMNAYVNLVMETVHSNLNDILQLKTQIKILNDLVLEKDQVISSLNEQVGNIDPKTIESEMQKLRDNASTWEFQYNGMKEKITHMDTLANQYNDLQKQFIEKTNELEKLSEVLSKLKPELDTSKQTVEILSKELQSSNKKIDRLSKKEEKKILIADASVPKKDINKEDTKSISISKKIVEKPKEIDDDF